VTAAAGVGFAGYKLITGWLKKRMEAKKIFGQGAGSGKKMPEMQQIAHGNIKRRSHARDWDIEGNARH
jgi:hypothetical protein